MGLQFSENEKKKNQNVSMPYKYDLNRFILQRTNINAKVIICFKGDASLCIRHRRKTNGSTLFASLIRSGNDYVTHGIQGRTEKAMRGENMKNKKVFLV